MREKRGCGFCESERQSARRITIGTNELIVKKKKTGKGKRGQSVHSLHSLQSCEA